MTMCGQELINRMGGGGAVTATDHTYFPISEHVSTSVTTAASLKTLSCRVSTAPLSTNSTFCLLEVTATTIVKMTAIVKPMVRTRAHFQEPPNLIYVHKMSIHVLEFEIIT